MFRSGHQQAGRTKQQYLLVVLVPQAGEHERQQRLVGEPHLPAAAAAARGRAAAAAHAALATAATA